jgi:hypothetical protein
MLERRGGEFRVTGEGAKAIACSGIA